MSDTDPWYSTFNDVFFLTLAGTLLGGLTMIVNAILKSRCKEFHCCGMGCVRDVSPPGMEPQVELDQVQIETHAPTPAR